MTDVLTLNEVQAARRAKLSLISTSIRYVLLFAVGLVMLYPLLWLVGASFKTNSEIFSGAGFIPENPTLDGYIRGWETSTPYTFGARVTATQATFRARQTTPVGAHEANAFGLFDVHGNVGEWVEDCYAPSYELAPIDGAAVQADECMRRVYRGGGYAASIKWGNVSTNHARQGAARGGELPRDKWLLDSAQVAPPAPHGESGSGS